MYYILDEANQLQPIDNIIEWSKWFDENQHKKFLNQTWIIKKPYGKAKSRMAKKINKRRAIHPKIWVSTVFLGLDHNYFGGAPITFESMAFSDGDFGCDLEQARHYTWDEAMAGHVAMVNKVKSTLYI